jgi:hypothetical protein
MWLPGSKILLSNRTRVGNTVQWIKRIVDQTRNNIDFISITKHLKTPKQIFDFAYNAMVYMPDPDGEQVLKLPLRGIKDEAGNCVDYTILQSAAMLNAGIPHKLRVVGFTTPGSWEHIYCVADDGSVMDPVIGQKQDGTETRSTRPISGSFNKECDYKYKTDYPVKTYALAGINGLNGKSVVNNLSRRQRSQYLGFLCVTNCDCKKECNSLFGENSFVSLDCHRWCDSVNAKKNERSANGYCLTPQAKANFINSDCSYNTTSPGSPYQKPPKSINQDKLDDFVNVKNLNNFQYTPLLIGGAAIAAILLLKKKKSKSK